MVPEEIDLTLWKEKYSGKWNDWEYIGFHAETKHLQSVKLPAIWHKNGYFSG